MIYLLFFSYRDPDKEEPQGMLLGVYEDKSIAMAMAQRERKKLKPYSRFTHREVIVAKASPEYIAALVKHGFLNAGDPPTLNLDKWDKKV